MVDGTGTNPGIATGEEAEPPAGVWRPAADRVIFQCLIETRAYPWKAMSVSKAQRPSYRRWKSWSADVGMVLNLYYRSWGGRCVQSPIDLDMLFVLDPKGSPPDRTNLGKSLEDLLQGIIYTNDRQVQGGDVRRVFLGDPIVGREGERWEGAERIHFRVISLA